MADINERSNFEEWKTLRAKTNWKIKQDRYDLLLKLDTLINDWDVVLPNLREIFRSQEIECLLVDSLNYWGGDPAKEKLTQRFIKFVVRTGYRRKPQVDEDGKPQLHQITPVHHVARRNCSNKHIVRDLMKIYDLNYIDAFGFRHFHVACRYGYENLVKKFLELGQDPNCVDSVTGDSPLHLAGASDNEHLIEVLLSHGAEPRSTNKRTGATPLHAICRRANNGAASAAQLFFDVADKLRRPVRVDALDKSDDAPLHLALKHGNRDAVGLLLRRGANPNWPNSEGSTALHLVCERYDGELFKTILEKSEDKYRPVHVDAKDENGNAPLHLALKRKKYDLAKLLLEAGADATASGAKGATPLHILCEKVNDPYEKPFIDLFERCQERNQTLRVNAQDALGNTPLHVFVQRRLTSFSRPTIDFFLRHGADLNLANNEGSTPLHIVCKMHRDGQSYYGRDFLDDWRREVAYALLENNANPNLANKKGMTPIHSALMKTNIDSALIATMLRRDGDPNLADEQGMTPLHLAVQRNNQNLIEMMLRRGGNLNLADKKGMTPFHFALKENNEALIIMLLRKGGNPNVANEEGMTPLHLVCSSHGRDGESADMLLELGGNDEHQPLLQIDARDKKGRTPLQLAVENFLPLTVEAILKRGADVSNFVFPAESCFAGGVPWLSLESRFTSKLKLAASAIAIVESLEKRGYEFYRCDALRIMKFFAVKQLFENASGLNKPWDDESDYASKVKEILISQHDRSQTLNDLIPLQSSDIVKRLAVAESRRVFSWSIYEYFNKREDTFIVHLCEKISRKFFQEWTLDPIVLLLHYRLPNLCCQMILENLTNRDLYNICLADPSLSS